MNIEEFFKIVDKIGLDQALYYLSEYAFHLKLDNLAIALDKLERNTGCK